MPSHRNQRYATPWFFHCPNCDMAFSSADYFDHLDGHSRRNLHVYLHVQEPAKVLANLLHSEEVRADVVRTLCHSRSCIEDLITGLSRGNDLIANRLRALLLPPPRPEHVHLRRVS